MFLTIAEARAFGERFLFSHGCSTAITSPSKVVSIISRCSVKKSKNLECCDRTLGCQRLRAMEMNRIVMIPQLSVCLEHRGYAVTR